MYMFGEVAQYSVHV